MTKNEFMAILSKRLKQRDVADIDEIIMEYEQHFACKLKDGYSEEEIARKLGDPTALADQYDPLQAKTGAGALKKAFVFSGLAAAGLFAGVFFLTLYAFGILLGILCAASAAIAGCLFAGISPFGWIPYIPSYVCAAILAAALLSLAVLSAAGVRYWFAFVRQMARAYGRYHKNCVAAAYGKATLPPLAVHAQLAPKSRRRLRRVAMVSLCVFAVSFIAGYIACALSAGAIEWWHAWNWFVS